MGMLHFPRHNALFVACQRLFRSLPQVCSHVDLDLHRIFIHADLDTYSRQHLSCHPHPHRSVTHTRRLR